ncbi:MAG: Ribonuclease Z [Gemmatimonadaceae bacterium]|nr:Ribonuclease Z [Gemmatimonadaceae bacterium]
MLFDCGEGTQRQMMRYGISFNIQDIYFTHFHTDHFLGVIGLMRTMSLQGRTEPLRLHGPRGATRVLRRNELMGIERLTFPIDICDVSPGDRLQRQDYEIVAFEHDHRGTPSLGYALIEAERRGRFHPDMARSLGVPEGPLWGKLHRLETITLDDGRVIDPTTLVGPPRQGRRIVLTGDTRPHAATIDAATSADVLVHEATFAEEEAARAAETGHSTAREAALVALGARTRRLLLTHISARYSRDTSQLEREARAVFPNTSVARDGMEVTIPFGDEETP